MLFILNAPITDSMASHLNMIISGLILSISMQWTLSAPGKKVLLFIRFKKYSTWRTVHALRTRCHKALEFIKSWQKLSIFLSLCVYFSRKRHAWAACRLLEQQRQRGTFHGHEYSAKHQKGEEHDPLHRRWWVYDMSLWHDYFLVLPISSHEKKPEIGLKICCSYTQ